VSKDPLSKELLHKDPLSKNSLPKDLLSEYPENQIQILKRLHDPNVIVVLFAIKNNNNNQSILKI
jgi:hypothetical protein